MQIVKYTPVQLDLYCGSSYAQQLENFKKMALKFKEAEEMGAVDFDIEPNAHLVAPLSNFLKWVNTHTKEQWDAGVKVPVKVIHEVCGKNHSPINDARRSCLVRVKRGNRRMKELDTYTLSRPHVLGLAKCLAAYTAKQAAEACIEMEQAVKSMIEQDRLDATLNPAGYEDLSSGPLKVTSDV